MVAALSGEHLLAAVDGRIPGRRWPVWRGAAARDVATTMRPHLVALSAEVRETVDLRMERQTVGALVDAVISDQGARLEAALRACVGRIGA